MINKGEEVGAEGLEPAANKACSSCSRDSDTFIDIDQICLSSHLDDGNLHILAGKAAGNDRNGSVVNE